MDYVLILRDLHSLVCDYALVIEDDAILAYDWFARVDEALRSRLGQSERWLYLKLFTGYKLFDWDWLWQPWVILKILLFSLFLYLVQYMIIYEVFPPKRISSFALFLIFVNSTALVVVFNTTCINPVGAGVHAYTTGFGLVSVLIPRNRLLNISDFLETYVNQYMNHTPNSKFCAKDLLLDRYRQRIDALELIIEPSLVQHIGIYSSLYQRDTSSEGYQRMFKSFSFVSHFKPIQFDLAYSLS